MNLRCFLAIDVNERVKKNIASSQEEMKKCEADVKFVEPENLHFTVKFLGNTDESLVPKIKSIVEGVVKNQRVFKVRIAGLGFHGSDRFVRNVWVGVGSGKEQLVSLFEEINKRLEEENFRSEVYQINPHITLCRTRTQKNAGRLIGFVQSKKSEPFGELEISSIKLKKSELAPRGPRYSDVFSVPLNQY